jgi:hypothetical protein
MALKRIPTTAIALAILGAVGASIFTLIVGGLWLLNEAVHYAAS